MYLCSYGKPARGGVAKKSISDASFRPTEAVHKAVDQRHGTWADRS